MKRTCILNENKDGKKLSNAIEMKRINKRGNWVKLRNTLDLLWSNSVLKEMIKGF